MERAKPIQILERSSICWTNEEQTETFSAISRGIVKNLTNSAMALELQHTVRFTCLVRGIKGLA